MLGPLTLSPRAHPHLRTIALHSGSRVDVAQGAWHKGYIQETSVPLSSRPRSRKGSLIFLHEYKAGV